MRASPALSAIPARSLLRAATIVLATAFGAWWLVIIGVVLGAVALSGLIFEYYRGEHAH